MGFRDLLRKTLGGNSSPPVETVKGPSRTLRDAGIDPAGLDFDFNADGSISVGGRVDNQAQCDRICEVLGDMPNVSSVQNNLTVGAAPAPEPEPEPAPEPEAAAPEAPPAAAPATEEGDAGRTYTVQSGDTLWKIAQEAYGSGAKYMAIFEANKDLLENPDRIFPGQELKIPDLED